jgi:hypothetical protein
MSAVIQLAIPDVGYIAKYRVVVDNLLRATWNKGVDSLLSDFRDENWTIKSPNKEQEWYLLNLTVRLCSWIGVVSKVLFPIPFIRGLFNYAVSSLGYVASNDMMILE